jgi:hypothetical protein
MGYQEQAANQRPIDVRCKCGWSGKSDQLTRWSIGRTELACPKCHAVFEAWPFRALEQAPHD